MIYLDNAASAPPCGDALRAAAWGAELCGNPMSRHPAGAEALRALEDAREGVAALFGVSPRSVYFTSGGTESNNHAAAYGLSLGGKVVTSEIEHASLYECLKGKAEFVGAPDGVVSVREVEEKLPGAAFVSIQHANNELGTVQPIEDIAAICRYKKVIFHTDAVQSAGHIPVPAELADLVSISAHKFHGPRGVGALIARDKIPPFMRGGAQERGVRAGSHNVAGAMGMAAALDWCMGGNHRRVREMRKRLEMNLTKLGAKINGSGEKLPGVVNAAFPGVIAEDLLVALGAEGICASAGPACAAGGADVSRTLIAAGCSEREARSSVRFSLSVMNTDDETDALLKALTDILSRVHV